MTCFLGFLILGISLARGSPILPSHPMLKDFEHHTFNSTSPQLADQSLGGFVGFDCGSNEIAVKSLSSIHVSQCEMGSGKLAPENKTVVVTQMEEEILTDFFQCLGITDHLVTRCGIMIDQVAMGGLYSEIVTFTKKLCQNLVKTGATIVKGREMIVGKPGEGSKSFSYVSWGSIKQKNADCAPGPTAYFNGVKYTRPIRNSKTRISYVSGKARIDTGTDTITFPTGHSCTYSPGECFIPELGSTYWTVKQPSCSDQNHILSVLYNGKAFLFNRTIDGIVYQFVQVTQKDRDFQLMLKKEMVNLCEFPTFRTEHPRILVTVLDSLGPSFPIKAAPTPTIDLLTYIDSKFMLSLRHTEQEFEKIYRIFEYERCKQSSKISDNMLTLATIAPEEFAYQYMKAPGFTAVALGEQIQLVKCSPVAISLYQSEKCYNELPVVYQGRPWYLTPRSRILVPYGREVNCTNSLRPSYYINGKWVTMTQHGVLAVENPSILSLTPTHYQFDYHGELSKGGLYSNEAIANAKKTLYLPHFNKVSSHKAYDGAPNHQNSEYVPSVDDASPSWTSHTIAFYVLHSSTGLMLIAVVILCCWLCRRVRTPVIRVESSK